MAYTQLIPQHTRDASVDEISGDSSHYLLSVAAGKADQYRLAQLDDYAKLPRRLFPHRPTSSLRLSARVSSDSIPGTWGFGFWNYPFGMSVGFGGSSWRLPTLPNAIWFFGASEENFLSFQESYASEKPRDERERDNERRPRSAEEAHVMDANSAWTMSPTPEIHGGRQTGGSAQRGIAANGFLAQSFRSPSFHPLLIPAGLLLPFSRKLARRLLGKVVGEEGIQLWTPAARRRSQEQAPGLRAVDPTQWHHYRLDWGERQVLFQVDGAIVFDSPVSPNPPLGLVIWIDNQYAAFTPEGKIGFGILENPEPAWLEVKDIDVM